MDLTAKSVITQVSTMDSDVFEIGLFKADAQPMMLPRTWDADTLVRSINWLKRQNLAGRNIYVRPSGEHHLSLVDDLKPGAVLAMKQGGFQPALVIETSPGNFQAWLKHPERLSREMGTAAARALAKKFGGDTGAADWRHFGRLAGFTNRKANHADIRTGLYPFVRVVEANGKVYPQAEKFLSEVRARLEVEVQERRRSNERYMKTPSRSREGLKPIEEFRGDPRYLGDNTRVDLAYAVYALSRGTAVRDVNAALRSRGLSHKGNERRQNEYAKGPFGRRFRG
jgi:RepB DNA-primase from phage plasmid